MALHVHLLVPQEGIMMVPVPAHLQYHERKTNHVQRSKVRGHAQKDAEPSHPTSTAPHPHQSPHRHDCPVGEDCPHQPPLGLVEGVAGGHNA